MAITFYYAPMSSAVRVHWALEELGVDYRKVRLDLAKGEQRAPELLAINPNGKVPALVDGGAKLFESLAILIHLGERYGVSRGLWPEPDSDARAEALSWIVWGSVQLGDCALDHALHANDELKFAFPKDKRVPHIVASSRQMWDRSVAILEARLQTRDFTLGDSFTLVDVANASMTALGAYMGKLPLDAAPRVQAWLQRCIARPANARVGQG